MDKTSRIVFAALTVGVLAAGVSAGWLVLAGGAHPGTAPTASQSSTPTPTLTPTPEPEPLAVGTVVAPDAELGPDQHAYPLADGTSVVVDATLPLPAPVQAQIEQRMGTYQAAYDPGTVPDDVVKLTKAFAALRSDEGKATGKTIVTVFRTRMFPTPAYDRPVAYWSLWPAPKIDYVIAPVLSWTREMAIGFATEYVAQQKNPETFAIVISG